MTNASEPPVSAEDAYETNACQREHGTHSAGIARYWRWSFKATLILTGAVVPIICFVAAWDDGASTDTPWQSGTWSRYAELLCEHSAAMAFYPLLVFSAASLIAVVVRPKWAVRHFLIRGGIYTGLILAIQYWLVILVVESGLQLIATLVLLPVSVAIGILFLFLLRFLVTHHRRFLLPALGFLLLGSLAFDLLFGKDFPGQTVFQTGASTLVAMLFMSLVCGTAWAVASYAGLTVFVYRQTILVNRGLTLRQWFAAFSWLSAYFAAWRISVTQMLAHYATLPTENPNCYIATAAAHGHRRLVGRRIEFVANGSVLPVNDQLRTLKAAELVLAHTMPRLHAVIRRAYDRVGPLLARLLVRPTLADAAYLTLKPCEWAARLGLRLTLGQHIAIVDRLYQVARPISPSESTPAKASA